MYPGRYLVIAARIESKVCIYPLVVTPSLVVARGLVHLSKSQIQLAKGSLVVDLSVSYNCAQYGPRPPIPENSDSPVTA